MRRWHTALDTTMARMMTLMRNRKNEMQNECAKRTNNMWINRLATNSRNISKSDSVRSGNTHPFTTKTSSDIPTVNIDQYHTTNQYFSMTRDKT
ncbi:hypothetical protein BDV12DRAFT_22645 [Aspergillus spectabilis]